MIKKLFYIFCISILLSGTSVADAFADQVVFNIKTSKYHSTNCVYARQCTKNCVFMDKDKAKEKGIPCKICHGGI